MPRRPNLPVPDHLFRSRPVEKHQRQGTDDLIPRTDWCDLAEIQGRDPDVLRSPTIGRAFERVVETWRPRHPIALVSLCTATRPYTASLKWSAFAAAFHDQADLIVCSNGGIIPLPMERCFPFLNYDAHGEAQFDDEYVRVVGQRLGVFLRQHRYRRVIFNFRHNMRNHRIAVDLGPALVTEGATEAFAILPTREQYEQAQRERFHLSGFKMFPELYPVMFDPLRALVATWAAECAAEPPATRAA